MSEKNDIFISYTHIDNQAYTETEMGWIADLHRLLEIKLGELLGETPKIWRDLKLKGNDQLQSSLENEFLNSSLLISVISPRYIKSDWCMRELEGFYGNRPGSGNRIFKVLKTPMPVDEQPTQIQDMLGYEFYQVDAASGRPKEFRLDLEDTRQNFLNKLFDLAYDISDFLKNLEKAGLGNADARVIYLAETSLDMKDDRDAIKRELRQHGHRVLPDYELPRNGYELQGTVRDYLKDCDLSLHLVGSFYGFVPEASSVSVIELQNQIAADMPGLKRLIWLPKNLQGVEDKQDQFLDDLKNNPEISAGAELVEDTLEEFLAIIMGYLERRESLPESGSFDEDESTPAQRIPHIYLVYDQEDAESVQSLDDYLFEDAGFEVIPSLSEGDESEVRQYHQDSMVECDAVLIFQGASGEAWLREKLRDLQKAPGFGRKKPFLGNAVYLGPPETPSKKRFRTREVSVLKFTEDFKPENLEEFVEKVKKQSGGE